MDAEKPDYRSLPPQITSEDLVVEVQALPDEQDAPQQELIFRVVTPRLDRIHLPGKPPHGAGHGGDKEL
ncbi:hypothetical protein [Compostimonas suwonensis]|uniref:Uncharacterized protein n=1 Tax=Compostimonas suwonensis TaxID=1048394 RepID=A0A2M9BW56_9MICO|nr:hypothetical protein [Compostimonas suwonensis]PJJ62188.1 hypothetical protein CLV54_1985 [Compostimonas suwonensis]